MPARIFALAVAGLLALPAASQVVIDVSGLNEIDDAELLDADGHEIGEIEEVLVDANGRPVALTFEIRDSFVDIDGAEVIFTFDLLTYDGGNYITRLTPEQVAELPRYDD